MISHTTETFRHQLSHLPADVRRRARQAYRLFTHDPNHSSLRFKPVHSSEPIYAVRVGIHHRAVGVRDGDEMVWFWIGSHADYDALLSRWRRKP